MPRTLADIMAELQGKAPKTYLELQPTPPRPEADQLAFNFDPPSPPALKPQPLRPMEKVALHNTRARAKAGKRLTLAEKALLGKHNLAMILARLKGRKA